MSSSFQSYLRLDLDHQIVVHARSSVADYSQACQPKGRYLGVYAVTEQEANNAVNVYHMIVKCPKCLQIFLN